MEPGRREPGGGQPAVAHRRMGRARRSPAAAFVLRRGRTVRAGPDPRTAIYAAGDGAASLGQNSAMRDLAHGVIGALIAYAVYKLAGHAVWSLAALAVYLPIYLMVRDRLPLRRGRDRTSDRT